MLAVAVLMVQAVPAPVAGTVAFQPVTEVSDQPVVRHYPVAVAQPVAVIVPPLVAEALTPQP